MSFSWIFNESKPGDKARESQVEKFFNSDVIANKANAIIREGIQNSLDAVTEGTTLNIRVKIGVYKFNQNIQSQNPYAEKLFDHLHSPKVSEKLTSIPTEIEDVKFLAFEDFGTTGLRGDYKQWWPDENGTSNPFFNFFRGEGVSDKTEGARGRHGVGRLVFMFASRARSFFALTRRHELAGHENLLMGSAVLRNHWAHQRPYLADGWFGVRDEVNTNLALPVQDEQFIANFKLDFGLIREQQAGLSIVVPWLDEEVNAQGIIESVLSSYYHPILTNKLVVEVVDENDFSTKISADTMQDICRDYFSVSGSSIGQMIEIAKASIDGKFDFQIDLTSSTHSPRWDSSNISEQDGQNIQELIESGEVVSIKVKLMVKPRDGVNQESSFEMHLQKSNVQGESIFNFIREGILISDVRPRKTSGLAGIILIEKGMLATLLGDSENPSHTQWQKDLIKDKYKFASSYIDLVVQSVPSLLSIISSNSSKPDSSKLIDLFSLPKTDEEKKQKEIIPKGGNGTTTGGTVVNPPENSRKCAINRLSGGFAIRSKKESSSVPDMLEIRVAYGVRKGSPFSKYVRSDFDFSNNEIKVELLNCECKHADGNSLKLSPLNKEFSVKVTGFDTAHRDLHIDLKESDTDDVALEVENAHSI